MRTLKNKLIVALAVLFMAMSVAFVGLQLVNVQASTPIANTIDTVAFQMQDGAFIRIGTDDGNNGIKFEAFMHENEYQALKDNSAYSNVSFGMVIAPQDYVDVYALNEENLFGENAKYAWEVNGEYDQTLNAGKARIINLTSSSMEADRADEFVYLRGSLVNLHDDNIAREFVGAAYIKVELAAGGVDYVVVNGDNSRSMAYVAQTAIKNNALTEEDQAWVNENYLAKVADVASSYKVNYYKQNPAGGEYALAESETITSTINANATFTEKAYDGYSIYAPISAVSGENKVLANDLLELDVYYSNREIIKVNGGTQFWGLDPELGVQIYNYSAVDGVNGSDKYSKRIELHGAGGNGGGNLVMPTTKYGVKFNVKAFNVADPSTPVTATFTTNYNWASTNFTLTNEWQTIALPKWEGGSSADETLCLLQFGNVSETVVLYVDEVVDLDQTHFPSYATGSNAITSDVWSGAALTVVDNVSPEGINGTNLVSTKLTVTGGAGGMNIWIPLSSATNAIKANVKVVDMADVNAKVNTVINGLSGYTANAFSFETNEWFDICLPVYGDGSTGKVLIQIPTVNQDLIIYIDEIVEISKTDYDAYINSQVSLFTGLYSYGCSGLDGNNPIFTLNLADEGLYGDNHSSVKFTYNHDGSAVLANHYLQFTINSSADWGIKAKVKIVNNADASAPVSCNVKTKLGATTFEIYPNKAGEWTTVYLPLYQLSTVYFYMGNIAESFTIYFAEIEGITEAEYNQALSSIIELDTAVTDQGATFTENFNALEYPVISVNNWVYAASSRYWVKSSTGYVKLNVKVVDATGENVAVKNIITSNSTGQIKLTLNDSGWTTLFLPTHWEKVNGQTVSMLYFVEIAKEATIYIEGIQEISAEEYANGFV